MSWPVTPLAFANSTPQFQVSRSLRFDGVGNVLANANRFEGNRQKFTQSVWVKRTALGTNSWLTFLPSGSFSAGLYFETDDRLVAFVHYNATAAAWQGLLVTQQPLRDTSSWYHINLAVDTTQVIPQNRIKLSINGSTVTAFLSAYAGAGTNPISYPPQNTLTNFNTKLISYDATNNPTGGPGYRYIGGSGNAAQYFNGYMSEVNYVDGQALDPIAFGRYDENGMWVPRRYNGAFGPNGYYVPFSDASTRGTLGLNANELNTIDPFRPFTVFHLQTRSGILNSNNNIFVDSNNLNTQITRTGNISQGTFNPYSLFGASAAIQGGSVYFDGRSDLEANATINFGANSYTVEFWVYSVVNMTSGFYPTAQTGPCFISSGAFSGWAIYNNVTSSKGITLGFGNGATFTDVANSNVPLPPNQWNHIAVSRSAPAGNAYAIWLNGTRILQGGDATTYLPGTNIRIGSYNGLTGINAGVYSLRGYMAGVHILNNVALYDPANATIAVPTAPPAVTASTACLLNFNNAAVYDAAGFFNLDTINSAAASTGQPLSLNNNSCLALGGSTTTPCVSSNRFNNYLINFDRNDFTVEAWLWMQTAPTGTAPTENAFIVSAQNNLASPATWALYVTPSRTISLLRTTTSILNSVNAIPLQTWVHVAAVKRNNTVTIYLNGVADVTDSITTAYETDSTAVAPALVIGRRPPQNSASIDPFVGFISDLRITRAARYVNNFVPSASPLPVTGSTQGWWPYTIQVGGNLESDTMLDVPANWGTDGGGALSSTMRGNYPTISLANKSAGFVASNGGLDVSSAAAANVWRPATATHAVSSGKWYWEVNINASAGVGIMMGVANTRWDAIAENPSVTYPGGDAALNSWGYYANGNMYRGGGGTAYGASYATSDVIGFALDMDNGTFYASKNGVWQGASNPSNLVASNPSIERNPINQISGRTFPLTGFHFPAFGVYGTDSYVVNFGQRPFVYANGLALSAGFKPICTTNIVSPLRRPGNFFEATSYTGGTNTFNPDVAAGQLVLALPLDSYNTYFDVSNEISNRISQPKALYTTAGVTYTSISGAAFNGTTGYIELSAHPDFDLGITGNWTIEWYQYWNVLTGNQTVWSNSYITIPNLLIQSQAGVGRHQLFTNGGTSILNEGSAPTPSLWYHYAVVKNGTTYTIFRNGSATGVTTYNAVTNAGSTTFRPEIGRGNGTFFLNGNIRDFRIYKGWAKYTTTFNPATATTAVVATTGTGFDKPINLGFQPDLVWVKARNMGRTSHILVDSVRGGTSTLSANSSKVAITGSNNVTFFQTGFTVGGSELPGPDYIIPPVSATFYSTGENTYGQLGLIDNSDRNQFTTLTGDWSYMACGYFHTMALSAGTTKWFATGENTYGQLGLIDNSPRNQFTALTGDWSYMVCGFLHTMAQSAGTTKWFATGNNTFGKPLGLGDDSNRNQFTALTGDWSYMVCGGLHTMAQSAGTTKWFSTGDNTAGQLGLIDNSERNQFTALTGDWSDMVCGYRTTMALSAGTTKWFATGENFYGTLGLGDTSNRNQFTALTGDWSQMASGQLHTVALSAGTTKWFGAGWATTFGLPSNVNVFTALTGSWSQMVCGTSYTMAQSAGTTKWFSTGGPSPSNGQLGLGDFNNRSVFTALTGDWSQMFCGGGHTIAFAMSAARYTIFNTGSKPFNPELNTPGATYTAYGWKRNTLAGFDIVGFDKTGATTNFFTHGLGKIPSMMIVKGYSPSTNISTWITYHEQANDLPANGYLSLATQSGFTTDSTIFGNNKPTARLFALGSAWGSGGLGGAGVAYLFAEIPGFSRFGFYTGNASINGPFVWCGFKPRFVLTKKVTGTSDWLIWDSSRGPINPISPHFTVNNNAADNSTAAPTYNGYLDFTATGFKLRLTTAPNDAGGYIFAAFADNPFGRVPGQVLAV